MQKERQSMEVTPKKIQMFKLVDKDFKAVTTTMHNIRKKNIYIVNKSMKIWQRDINYNKISKDILGLKNKKLINLKKSLNEIKSRLKMTEQSEPEDRPIDYPT